MNNAACYKKLKNFVSVMILMLLWISAPGIWSQEHDALEYEVSVKALQVPFVAVDAKGNPVFDLKSDELELYVNKKPVNILYLYGLAFGDAEVAGESASAESPAAAQPTPAIKPPPVKKVNRLKFIIVDSLFNSNLGLKHAKMIARELIENGAPEDRFVLLEIRLGGLKYIAGPGPGGKDFLQHLTQLRKNPQKLPWWQRPERRIRADAFDVERYLMEDGMKNARKDTVKMYLDAFEQFQDALRTIDEPKVTYLLSEGFASHTIDGFVRSGHHNMISYKGFEGDMVKKVHDGGSVLKRVPVGKLMPHQTGFAARWLNRSTAAYYEVFFNPGADAAGDLNIEIKCKRKGVRIDAVGHKEKEKPYQKLNKVRKKLFAIDVAAGRSWSRMLGRVRAVPYEKLDQKQNGAETLVTVGIPIPEAMRDREVDVFALRFDEKFQDADVAMSRRTAGETETVTLPTKKNKTRLYFVIVEPNTALCIYNKIEL
jgi:hypothetical protein